MKELEMYLKKTKMMTLATVNENKEPYVSTVYFAYNLDKKEIYFLSKHHREHSQHILQNDCVSVAIVDQTQKPETIKVGLQLFGKASLLNGATALAAKKSYDSRLPEIAPSVEEVSRGTDGHKIWAVKISKAKIWDEKVYGGDGKVISL